MPVYAGGAISGGVPAALHHQPNPAYAATAYAASAGGMAGAGQGGVAAVPGVAGSAQPAAVDGHPTGMGFQTTTQYAARAAALAPPAGLLAANLARCLVQYQTLLLPACDAC